MAHGRSAPTCLMCGIAGIVLKPNVTLDNLRERARAMNDAMTHRGPDDAGEFFASDGRVALVNRRLAIRDVSPLGRMPMETPDAPIALTYNGEIYNADALRTELERAGYTFRSTSDTEVILRGYQAWGEAIIPRLRGIFALVFYDGRGRILLARDHLGVKPLYYAETDKGLLFASELKALRASGLIARELDPTAVVGYLELGSIPSPRTIYRDVRILEPASLLNCDLATLETRLTRYWSLPTQECPAPRDVVEQTRATLLDAVKSQLVSDVPLGAFLSGGLDSSAMVALMRQATNGVLRTCSIVFDEAEYSEAPFARAVAEQVGAEHFERRITSEDVKRELPRMLWAMDQPSIDGVNSYFVSQTARQAGLTVALSGTGGDELFGGYPSFYAAPRVESIANFAKDPRGNRRCAHCLSHRARVVALCQNASSVDAARDARICLSRLSWTVFARRSKVARACGYLASGRAIRCGGIYCLACWKCAA